MALIPKRRVKRKGGGFTEKQIKFIQYWDGNIASTAKAAGLNPGYCATLIKRDDIKEAIKNRTLTPDDPKIADKLARQLFWTKIMHDEKQKMQDRLRASELLGRSEMDFTEKRIIEGNMTIEEKLRKLREEKNE